MTKSLVLVSLFTLGLSATGALAQAAPHRDGAPTEAQRAAWHSERCADRYAHRVAMVAYIETRLALADSQRSAFDAWKHVVLSEAKSGQDACAGHMRDMNGPPNVVERDQQRVHMLKARVEFLDAELPALTALYQTLTPEQKLVLDRSPGEHRGPDGGRFGHHGHDGHGGDEGGPGKTG